MIPNVVRIDIQELIKYYLIDEAYEDRESRRLEGQDVSDHVVSRAERISAWLRSSPLPRSTP